MATYDLEEQEQLAELKAWWKQYGNMLTNILLAVMLVVAGWQGWNWYQRGQSGQSAAIYGVLQKAVQEKDLQKVKAASGELLEKFGSTSYASLGALSAAKALVEADDAKTAKLQLSWVAEHGNDELRDLARLRLAALLLDDKEFDQALKQLEGAVSPSFEVLFVEMKGDIYSAQGKRTEAAGSYQAGLGKLKGSDAGAGSNASQQARQDQSLAIQQQLLQQKLDALGGGAVMRKFPSAASFALILACFLTGCSTLEDLNPFADRGPKMAELQPIKTTLAARVVWQQSIGKSGLYSFTPAVLGSTVYAAGGNGDLIRIDGGKQTWKINVEQPLSGGVGADGSTVVVGSSKGDLLAFSSADGKPLWQSKTSSEILSPPVLGAGMVIVRSGDNRLAAYDLADGKRKWFFQRPTPTLSLRASARPLIDGKYVFAGFPGGKLIAVSTSNGASAWDGTVALPKGTTELDRVADITSTPVISGRSVCAAAFQGRVACFDLGNGNLVWARDMSSAAGIDIDSRFLYVSDDKGAVHALDMASGASIWKQDKLSFRRLTAPVARRGYVAVADAEGVVHFLSSDDGSFIARVKTDGSPVVAPPQKIGDGMLVQTTKGGIYAIEAE